MFVRKVLTLLVFPSPKDGLFLQSQIWFVLKKIFLTKCSSDLISTMNDNSFQNWGAPMHGCLKGHVLLMQYSHNFFYYSSKGVAECCQGYVWDKIDNRCIPTRKIIPKKKILSKFKEQYGKYAYPVVFFQCVFKQ